MRASPDLRALICGGIWVLLLGCVTPSFAQQSYFRLYDQTAGLNVGEVVALAQDDTGFLWLGTHRGLVRFDGHNFVAWAHPEVDELVDRLAYGPNDDLIAVTFDGRAWQRRSDTLEALRGPRGTPVVDLQSLDFDREGNLWAIIGHALWRRDRAHRWQRVDSGIPSGETPQIVRAVGASIIVLTQDAAWRLHDHASADLVLREPDIGAAAGNGAVLWLARKRGGGLWKIDATGTHEMASPANRLIDVQMRRNTLWLAYDTKLVAIESNGRQRTIGAADGLPSGGPLLVDRDDSLWLGTFTGLVQFPEPDTWHWSVRDGLPWPHARAVAEMHGDIWISTWNYGLARIDPDDGALSRIDAHTNICSPEGTTIWATLGDTLATWQQTRFVPVGAVPAGTHLWRCADDNGDHWFSDENGHLLRLRAHTSNAAVVTIDGGESADLIWSDAGTLYFANRAHVCRLHVRDHDTAAPEDCVATAHPRNWTSQIAIAPNLRWLAAFPAGVYAFDGTHLRELHGSEPIEGGSINTVSKAANGDVWLSGTGVLERVRPCIETCAADWNVLETPGLWQGLPGNAGAAVLETANGDLWIAGNRGVWRIPQRARSAPRGTPTIVPIAAHIDAQMRRLGDPLQLLPSNHRLELEFAALSYRDRSLLRFRSRVGDEGGWSAPTPESRLQFAALEPGSYHAEMSASLDGVDWSAPASVAFRVLPPWYRTGWAYFLFALGVILVVALIYHLRVSALLRVESERTRIAMDLHDEIGSGLGSIGMLAGAAARTAANDAEHQRIAREIAEISGLLGSGLRSLVWSLRSGKTDVAELGEQVADHARRLFPEEPPRLSLRMPEGASSIRLAPEIRRHLLLLALEALHNVARHARAENVQVSLGIEDRNLVLSIEDDGVGFDDARDASGSGLESMRRRAEAIHAHIELSSAPGRGTRVCLTCPLARMTMSLQRRGLRTSVGQ